MNDQTELIRLNEQFIAACRTGSWSQLEPILSTGFRYVDGVTGELWPLDRYIADHESSAVPDLEIDDVVVHVDGDSAGVSARTSTGHRYLDVYARTADGWQCTQACVWPDTSREGDIEG
jgi:hypothetical protein